VRPHNVARREVLLGIGAAAGIAACGGTAVGGRKQGVAIIGIGEHSLKRIIPAILQTDRCHLAGLISSGVEKLRDVGGRFGVPESAQYVYDDLERIADNPDIDFVYVAVPNALHAEFAIRAARAGKHVLVEKPMAVSVEQCEAMTAASTAAGKFLAIAYRVQFDTRHLEMQRLAHEQVFGMPKLIRADIGFPLTRDDWRVNHDLSGGVVMEQGVYAVNAACGLMREQPVEVVAYEAKSDSIRFANVEESVFWSMQFASGAVAQCATSYSVRMNGLRVDAVEGYFELQPAYSEDGLRGSSTAGNIGGDNGNQIARQLDEFAGRIENGVAPTLGSPAEGLRDVKIIAAIHESLRSGRSVSLA
jgi:predicted dehydrogenase